MGGDSEPTTRLTTVTSLRKSARTFVTKKFNEKSTFAGLDENQLRALLHTIKSKSERLLSLDEEFLELFIQLKSPSEASLDEEVAKGDDYQDKAAECIALLQGLLAEHQASSVSAYRSRSVLNPPQTPLPSFEGKDTEDIARFLVEFDKAIQPYKYTDYDKFLLLKRQTTGKAGSLLGSLDASKQTFRDAKSLLEQAFGDKKLQKYRLLDKLTSLNLQSTDPFELYSEFNNLTSSLENMILTVKDLYSFALWKALPHDYQTQYLAYSTDSIPELDVLKRHYFDVCRRVQSSENQPKEKPSQSTRPKPPKPTEALTLAMGVKSSKSSSDGGAAKDVKFKPYCSLCQRTGHQDSHKIGQCKIYPTAHDKVNKLKALGGCTKCTSLKHSTVECNYRGEKCRTCGGLHHNILCISNKSSTGGESNLQAKSKKQ